jgi:hypothetical protein
MASGVVSRTHEQLHTLANRHRDTKKPPIMANVRSFGNLQDASAEHSEEQSQLINEARRIVEQEKSLPGTVRSVQRKDLMRW